MKGSGTEQQGSSLPSRHGARHQWRSWAVLLTLASLLALVGVGIVSWPVSAASKRPPNILLIVMDDIGIDQWQLFGYGGTTPAAMPNVTSIARAGIKFGNLWAMPACSNGRAALFTGRYPFRTHVYTAIGNEDLANFQINPNEVTVPQLLKQRGYKSALFGKFHVGIQSNNPYGYGMVQALGWDYFDGWLDDTGDPSSIDETAGGVSPPGTWSCGFVRDASDGGADTGACYAASNTCQVITKSGTEAPGRVCRDAGGIFDPNQPCNNPIPGYINFATLSGHYVSPLVINNEDGSIDQVPSTDLRARTYRGTEVVDAAIAWINQQSRGQPWMASVAFATAHTPVMQPPSQLLPSAEPDTSNLDCSNSIQQRILTNQMEEALDSEVGRLLVSTGLASRSPSGQLSYHPKETGTYVILVTDNGSTPSVVKPPFDPTRAKSTVYQTGVWCPGIVAGPAVKSPGRKVDAMVNIADLYQLFGELAGIDVHASVSGTVDAQSMFPYLVNPGQPSIRKTNYTEIGTNLHANGAINGPCQYNTTTCTQIAPTKGVCEDNNGIWWGAGATDPSTAGIPPDGLTLCCDVAIWQANHAQTISTDIYPLQAFGIRNDRYKLVVNSYHAYDATSNSCVGTTSTEFYSVNEKVPVPKLDTANADLLATGTKLNPQEQKNYDALTLQLKTLLASQPACPADINLDGVVNYLDIAEWAMFQELSAGNSSWADLNLDGRTNGADLTIILQNLGACPAQ
ncbi:MAG: sulfatase-like hydrolase/transferase [Methyloceanibacter sp.]